MLVSTDFLYTFNFNCICKIEQAHQTLVSWELLVAWNKDFINSEKLLKLILIASWSFTVPVLFCSISLTTSEKNMNGVERVILFHICIYFSDSMSTIFLFYEYYFLFWVLLHKQVLAMYHSVNYKTFIVRGKEGHRAMATWMLFIVHLYFHDFPWYKMFSIASLIICKILMNTHYTCVGKCNM